MGAAASIDQKKKHHETQNPELKLVSLADVHNGELEVNVDVLHDLLTSEEVKGKPLAIISIAGTSRSGKSFIMNFFIRYLRKQGWKNPKWFGDGKMKVASGFPSQRGSEACTKGIHVWPETFLMPLSNGRQAAVLMVDTQGLFDSDTSPDTNSKIMSISTLFCSHQILNIMKQVEERDLEHLQLCVALSEAAASNVGRNEHSKLFPNLTFLVRDWERNFEHAVGESTDGYLKHQLKKQSRSKEVDNIKSYIFKAFDKVKCFLLPHPGWDVPRNERLINKDLEENFRDHTKALVEKVLDPRNIAIKKTPDGREATAEDLMSLIGTIGNFFNSGGVPTVKSLLQAVVIASNTEALNKAVKKYGEIMIEHCGEMMKSDVLMNFHEEAIGAAKNTFHSEAMMGDENSRSEFLPQLEKECKDKFSTFKDRNEGKKEKRRSEVLEKILKYESEYQDEMKKCGLETNDNEFNSKHKKNKDRALEALDSATMGLREILPDLDSSKAKLENKIETLHENMKTSRERQKLIQESAERNFSDKCVSELEDEFQNETDCFNGVYASNLSDILNASKASYLKKYDDAMSSIGHKEFVKNDKGRLEKNINFLQARAMSRNNELKQETENELEKKVSKFVSEYEKDMSKCGLDTNDNEFNTEHEKNKDRALDAFESATRGLREILSDLDSSKAKLENKIEILHSNMKTSRERQKLIQERTERNLSDEYVSEFEDEFQNETDRFSGAYASNLSDILNASKAKYLKKYDDKMSSISHEEFVKKNKERLEKKIDFLQARATSRNNELKQLTKNELRQKVLKFASAYEKEMSQHKQLRTSDSSFEYQHEKCMKSALETYDSETNSLQYTMPDVQEQKKELESKMSQSYEYMKQARVNLKLTEENRQRDAALACWLNVIEEFQEELGKYKTYTENLDAILAELKPKYLLKYDRAVMHNSQKEAVSANRKQLEKDYDYHTQQALSKNAERRAVLVLTYEASGVEFANEYAAELEETLAKAYIKPEQLKNREREFLINFNDDEKVRAQPDWGRQIMKKKIVEQAERIRRRNEDNKRYRSVTVKKVFKTVGSAIWKIAKKLVVL